MLAQAEAIVGEGDRERYSGDDILLLDFVELKGVWGGNRYPVVAIDTQSDHPVNKAFKKFETTVSAKDLWELCDACYRSDDWPCVLYLPDSTNDDYTRVPSDPLDGYSSTSSVGAESPPPEEGETQLPSDVPMGADAQTASEEGDSAEPEPDAGT